MIKIVKSKISLAFVITNLFLAINCMDDKSEKDANFAKEQETIAQSGVISIPGLQHFIGQYSTIPFPALLHLIAKYVGSQCWQSKEIFPENEAAYSYKILLLSPDGKYVLALSNVYGIFGDRPQIEIWDSNSKKHIETLKDMEIRSIDFCHDNKLAIACCDSLKMYDIDNKKYISSIDRPNLMLIEYSKDGKYLASLNASSSVSSFGNVELFDLNENNFIALNGIRPNNIRMLNISPDSKIMIIVYSDFSPVTIKFWDLKKHQSIKTLKKNTYSRITDIKYSPNSKYLAFNFGTRGELLDAGTYETIHNFNNVSCMGFSSDNQYLAMGRNGSIEIINLIDMMRPILTLSHNSGYPINSILYSPDGKYLFSCCTCKIIKWEISDYQVNQ